MLEIGSLIENYELLMGQMYIPLTSTFLGQSWRRSDLVYDDSAPSCLKSIKNLSINPIIFKTDDVCSMQRQLVSAEAEVEDQEKPIVISKLIKEKKLKPGEIRKFISCTGRIWKYKLLDSKDNVNK